MPVKGVNAAQRLNRHFCFLFLTCDAGDSLSYQSGSRFSAYDNDNDMDSSRNCAAKFQGGWWFRRCLRCNLNGRYIQGGQQSEAPSTGVLWSEFKGVQYSLQYAEMKIRPKN